MKRGEVNYTECTRGKAQQNKTGSEETDIQHEDKLMTELN